MMNMPKPLRTHAEDRTRAMIQSDIADMKVLPIGRAMYIVTLIYEVSACMRAFHMTLNGGEAEILKC